MAANIVSPTGRSSLVWKYFGFAKDCDGTLSKEKAVCKLCSQKVAHGGGTTNMKNHLKTKHLAEFNMLYQEEPTTSSQSSLDAFIVSKSVKKFSANSEMAKKLNEGLADFITRDLRPVSVVDGAGFLNLMHLAEPRYTIPCRKSLMEIIDSRYNDMKRSVCGVVSQQEFITLTSDMWTSRAGDGFISLTAHYLTDTFDLEHKTLQCLPLPGHHDHTSISSAITCCTGNWLIDIAKNVTAFTTDNGSNIVKAVEEDLKCTRIPCAGHTLNLSVSAGLEVNAISKVIARSKKVVTHFNQSRIDREQLAQKQELLGIQKHTLIQAVQTRWNSVFDMLSRLCEQQAAIGAVLHSQRELLHLEHTPVEWRLIEDLLDLLKPFKDATTYLSSQSYPTLSVLGPLLVKMKDKIKVSSSDSQSLKSVKQAIGRDLDQRYQDPAVRLVLNKASFLDPRMKTLPHLSPGEQEEVLDSLVNEILTLGTSNSHPPDADSTSEQDTQPPSAKKSALENILGEEFFTTTCDEELSSATTVSLNELILSELSRFKAEPLLKLQGDVLLWWRQHAMSYPNLSKMARKYLGIVATSVPSERLFSATGNIVNAKRSSLDPFNVEKLVFLHDNAPKITSLHYKRIN